MCRKSEGPSELIGSAGDKGGLLQKRNPGEMFTQGEEEEGRRILEAEPGRVEGLSDLKFIPDDVPVLRCYDGGGFPLLGSCVP